MRPDVVSAYVKCSEITINSIEMLQNSIPEVGVLKGCILFQANEENFPKN